VQREAKDRHSGVPALNGMNALTVADTQCNLRCGGASASNMDVVREGSPRSLYRRRGSWRRSLPCIPSLRSLLRVMTTSATLARLASANSTCRPWSDTCEAVVPARRLRVRTSSRVGPA
jgi:hypothetical protein